jgi:YVTN family beta-propeller protein
MNAEPGLRLIRQVLTPFVIFLLLFAAISHTPDGHHSVASSPTALPSQGGRETSTSFADASSRTSPATASGADPSGPHVNDTIVPFNDSVVEGNYLAPNGLYPVSAVVDTSKDEVFITTLLGVAVLAASNDTIVDQIPVGQDCGGAEPTGCLFGQQYPPSAIAYDPQNGTLFVANEISDDVSVISDANDQVVATFAAGYDPDAIAYDSEDQKIFVIDRGQDSQADQNLVNVFNASSYSLVGTVQETYGCSGAVYDPSTDEVFVSDEANGSVEVISGSNYSTLASIGGFDGPLGMAYDPGTHQVFVANNYGTTVSVVSDSSNSIVANIGIPGINYATGLWAVAYDPTDHEVFVTAEETYLVDVFLDTNDSYVGSVGVGEYPEGIAYDSVTGHVFAMSNGPSTVTVISALTDTVLQVVPVGVAPTGLAFDSATDQLFVTDYYQGRVLVVSATTYRTVAAINVGPWPYGIAYDSDKGDLFVTNEYANTVTVVSDANDTVVGMITLGPESADITPTGIAYDPVQHEVYVADYASNNVTVISDSNDSVVANIGAADAPNNIVYDSEKDEMFVSGWEGRVTIISDSSLKVVGSVSFPDTNLGAVAYDPSEGEVWVANYDGYVYSYVYGISDSTNTVVSSLSVGGNPWGVAYDPTRGQILVTGQRYDNLWVFQDSSGSMLANFSLGVQPMNLAVDDATGTVFAGNYLQGTISVISGGQLYPVTFLETGLPPGTNWSVNLNGVTYASNSTSLEVVRGNGTYPFTTSSSNSSYFAPAGNLSVDGVAVVQTLTFGPRLYPVTVSESGLPVGTRWWLNLSSGESFNSTGSTIAFSEVNGQYGYGLGSENKSYSAAGGSFTVNGAPVSTMVGFVLVTFLITFEESGLPPGTEWWANVTHGAAGNSAGDSIEFEEANGTYVVHFASANASYSAPADVVPVRGSGLSVQVSFALVTFPVGVAEQGLPAGLRWSVTVAGSQLSLVTNGKMDQLSFPAEPNGTYAYSVVGTPGWHQNSTTYAGSLAVRDSPLLLTLDYVPEVYQVDFVESGLPAGTTWSATLNGTSHRSSTANIAFYEPNSTYSYTIGTVMDYRSNVAYGSVTINGSTSGVPIHFIATSPPPGGLHSQWLSVLEWALLGFAIAAFVAVAIVLLMRRGKRGNGSDAQVPRAPPLPPPSN